ncbi:MAG: serine/threonine protein kinase [Polyangiaceae bacterium]|nr:serine/threonine protein kinase [Polyangiaceae bacterium]
MLSPRELAATVAESLAEAATAFDLGATIRPDVDAAVDATKRTLLSPVPRTSQQTVTRNAPVFGSIPQLSLSLALEPGDTEVEHGSDIVLTSLLAEGGMGRVYLAEQRSLGRPVAVKTVKDARDGAQARALLTEGAITGYLEHPNVLPVHLLGYARSGEPVLVMKRIVGASWLELLADAEHAAWPALLDATADRLAANLGILMQVAAAAHHAHLGGLVHRDIKPENVMIGTGGEVYLVDWGIASAAGESATRLAGTPRYLAPEMVSGGTIEPRTDVYLLGATLHHMLTGSPRHAGATLADVLESAIASKPFEYGDDVAPELAALANEATAKEPGDRPQDAAAFRSRIAAFLAYRGAFSLAGVADARLAELRSLRAEGKLDDPRLVRLASEARFGFEQALSAHPDYERAREGVRDVLIEQLALEIDRKNVAASRALVAELGADAASLLPALEKVEAAVERERVERDRLEKIARDTDVTPALRWIGMGAAGLCVLSTISQVLIQALVGTQVKVRGTVIVGGFFTMLGVVTVALLWRRLSTNKAALRLAILVVGALASVLLHRIAGLIASDSAERILRDDMFVLSVCCLAAGLFGRRRWLYSCPVMLTGGYLAALLPHHVVTIFGLTTLVALLILSAELWWGKPATREDV